MKKRILCFGDSNTWGYNGEDGNRFEENVRWTGRLQTLLGEEYTVIEEGHNGRTTVWDDPVENRMAGLTYLWPCMESQSPFDLIIIMLGTNDTKTYFGSEAVSIARGAGRLVTMAQQSPFGRDKNAPKVLLVSPILLAEDNDAPMLFGKQGADKSKGFADAFRETADTLNCYYMDAAAYAKPGAADGIHMDAENHEKLAHAMYEMVRRICEQDGRIS